MAFSLFRFRNPFTTRSKRVRTEPPARWRPVLELLEGRLLPSTFPVTSMADSGPNTLRQAILNANTNPGADIITFAISGPGVHEIQPLSALPPITGSVRIDATTQSGYAGTPLIQLDGSLAGSGANGLTIDASSCTILGLDITHFNADGILVQGDKNVIQSNYIGTDPTGTKGQGNGGYGVEITGISTGNLVGTNGDGVNDAAERNLLSGNGNSGVRITGTGANQNVIAGNYIGTDFSGTAHISNGGDGVSIENGAESNLVGTNGMSVDDTGERNILSGNAQHGVFISGSGTNSNIVAGNFIGTNVEGTVAIGNGLSGVRIDSGAQSNQIGTNADGKGDVAERNVISANRSDGVVIVGANQNVVAGDYIGTDVSGNLPLGNAVNGVQIDSGAQSNLVGSNGDGVNDLSKRNVISGNLQNGVYIHDPGTNNNLVAGNYIGTNAAGTAALPNGTRGGNGVQIGNGASFNLIGINPANVDPVAERNVISGNVWSGVRIGDPGSDGNTVAGNFIGTDKTGAVSVPNLGDGVRIETGAQNNVIGGSVATANIIAFNGQAGIKVLDALTTGNSFRANSIFSNTALGIDLNGDGVTLNAPGVRGGANDTQNYPVLARVASTTTSTQVTGSLNSLPSQAFTIDFYASPTADPSGYGQGKRYLGSAMVTTNASGNAALSATLPVGGLAGQVISATATAASGDTSEFSKDVTATAMAARTAAGSVLSTVDTGSARSTGPVSSESLGRQPALVASDLVFTGDANAGRIDLRQWPKHGGIALGAFHRRSQRSENSLPAMDE